MLFPSINNIPTGEAASNTPVEWQFDAPDRTEYQRSIEHVKTNQRNGNSYLANLTCKVPIHTNLTMREIFLRSTAKYRCWLKKQLCLLLSRDIRSHRGADHTLVSDEGNHSSRHAQRSRNIDEQCERGCRTRYHCRPDTQRFEHCCQSSKRGKVSLHRQTNHQQRTDIANQLGNSGANSSPLPHKRWRFAVQSAPGRVDSGAPKSP